MPSVAAARSEPKLSRLQSGLLVLLVFFLVASVGLRAYVRVKESSARPGGGHGLVQNDDGSRGTNLPAALVRSLPYVAEGSFFGLIGFALGYATRKFVKLGLILVAIFFVCLQALVWTGTVSVDWDGLLGKLDALLFNLEQNETMQQFWTHRIPSGGGMLLGYLIGFQRG